MSSNGDEEIPSREIAYRLFAAEYDDATLSHTESDEERAPNYVITPTGARLNRLFVVGTLTEVTSVNDEMVRARVVDPTGAFVVYAGQYQPDALATLEQLTPPAFVAVTGKARTFQPDDSDRVYTSIRPESIATVDADTRDRWVLTTAERTLDRIGTYATAMGIDASGPDLTQRLEDRGVEAGLAAGVPIAADHYGTTPDYLSGLSQCAREAVAVIAGDREQVSPFDRDPSDRDHDSEQSFAALASLADIDSLEQPEIATEPSAIDDTVEDAGETESALGTGSAIGTASESVPTSTETGVGAAADPTDTETSVGADDDSTDTETSVGADDDSTDTETSVGVADRSASADEPTSADDPDTTDEDDLGDFGERTQTAEEGSRDEELTADSGDDDSSSDDSSSDDSSSDDSSSDDDITVDDGSSGDELGDFDADGMYQMDDEEREQIESEFGTEFTTGTDVDEPGESDIDVPSADDHTLTDDRETVDSDETPAPDEPAVDTEPERAETESETAEDEEDIDLDALLIETMTELDDGDGADRSTLVDTVADDAGVEEAAVEDAIQDALMGGQCYEPDDETLKPI